MIWHILLGVFGLVSIMLYFGYSKYNEDTGLALLLIAYTIIFLSGVAIIFDGLEYKNGEEMYSYYKYGNNFTSYHWDYSAGTAPTTSNPNDVSAYIFHVNETTTDIYSDLDDFSSYTLGFLLAILGGLGFSTSMMGIRSNSRGD